jgi:AI-2 transport protein TqsA
MQNLPLRDIRAIRNILLVFLGVLIIYMMKELSYILIPFVLALFISILLQPVLAWLDRKRVPFGVSLFMISAVTIGILYLFGLIIISNGQHVFEEKDYLVKQVIHKISLLISNFNAITGLSFDADSFLKEIPEYFSNEKILSVSGKVAGALGGFTTTFIITAIYIIMMMTGILKYENYLRYLDEGNKTINTGFLHTFEQVKTSIVTYIKVKFVMSVCTGFGVFLVCTLFGIKFASFWGFFAFMTNFVPTIGSITGSIPPCLMGLIQFDSFGMVILIIVVIFMVQTLFGNILEPIFMGNRVALNTITIIMGLIFWGYLWGIYGMLLAVPLLVLVKVILSQVGGAEILVKLMGPTDGGKKIKIKVLSRWFGKDDE